VHQLIFRVNLAISYRYFVPRGSSSAYDLSKLKGVRGKYATRYQAGTNLVLLSPDVAKYFPDEQSVNIALRKLIHVTKVKKIS
jgi:hypothetical protein